MKKILLLAVALLGAVCVEIYSSQQELKFDEGVPTYPTLTRGGQTGGSGGAGEGCEWSGAGGGSCKISRTQNCVALPNNGCQGAVVKPDAAQ